MAGTPGTLQGPKGSQLREPAAQPCHAMQCNAMRCDEMRCAPPGPTLCRLPPSRSAERAASMTSPAGRETGGRMGGVTSLSCVPNAGHALREPGPGQPCAARQAPHHAAPPPLTIKQHLASGRRALLRSRLESLVHHQARGGVRIAAGVQRGGLRRHGQRRSEHAHEAVQQEPGGSGGGGGRGTCVVGSHRHHGRA